jgi:hypothetical protein
VETSTVMPRPPAVDLVPEVAPRLGVDAGRGLVQQQQARLVQQAGGQRQALLPAARQRAGQLALALGQAQLRQRGIDRRGAGSSNRRAMKSRFSRIDRSSYRPKRCVM